MYSDAYGVAVPPERLEAALQVFTSCRLAKPLRDVWRCAQQAAAGTFCPCVTAAAGAIGPDDRVVFEAVAGEIRRRMAPEPDPAAATPPASDDRREADGGHGASDLGRGMSEEAIDETLKASFPASDPPSWTLRKSH